MTRITALEDRIIAASQQASSMEAWLKREIYTCCATRREETANPLGETGWQPTIGRIQLWSTDVEFRHNGHTCTIRAFFDGADIPSDAIRESRWTEELAIEEAERMKKQLIEMHESRLRRKWVPAE